MSRKPRKMVESGVYHVIMRGNDQQNIFYDDSDRKFMLDRIRRYSVDTGIEIYAFCFMNNHIHFLIGRGNENQRMANFVKKLACSYVYRFNHKYERSGHLFQGRYKSEPIETPDDLKYVYRYIIKNPEKAGVCSYKTYQWQSLFYEDDKELIEQDFINQLFSSKEDRMRYLEENESYNYMEAYTHTNWDDDEVKALFIKQLLGIDNLFSIDRDNLETKKQTLHFLKSTGLSINQIARITGINRYLIRNA
ncbi:MAG: transposase [Treponema sp.]|nr:transposase [Treponema sp.]